MHRRHRPRRSLASGHETSFGGFALPRRAHGESRSRTAGEARRRATLKQELGPPDVVVGKHRGDDVDDSFGAPTCTFARCFEERLPRSLAKARLRRRSYDDGMQSVKPAKTVGLLGDHAEQPLYIHGCDRRIASHEYAQRPRRNQGDTIGFTLTVGSIQRFDKPPLRLWMRRIYLRDGRERLTSIPGMVD